MWPLVGWTAAPPGILAGKVAQDRSCCRQGDWGRGSQNRKVPGSEEICRFLANLFADVANRGELGFVPLCQLLFLHLINRRQLHPRALPTTGSFTRVAVVWPVANIFSLQAGR